MKKEKWKVDTSLPWAKRFKKNGNLTMKRRDLPACPICGSPAFLTHDFAGEAFVKQFPEGSLERKAFENWLNNNGGERMDIGYSCGCSAYRPNDGVHMEPMACGIKTRRAAMMWWLKKVDEILGRAEI